MMKTGEVGLNHDVGVVKYGRKLAERSCGN